ncbi:MAG TPA: DRTGG domain-containing protein [Candidatus Aminicenantes bacterium]|nr:DRTGG domain-containing protein [Candidatus Aminicenantes bacterium]
MIVLKDVLALLEAELLTPKASPEAPCRGVFASDLMSDVLASAEAGSLLLTGLANAHVVSACSVADLAAVVFVQGKRPDPGVVAQALSRGLPLLATKLSMFEACSRIARFIEDGGHAGR